MTGDPPIAAIRDVVRRALAEDFGAFGDITSTALIPEHVTGVGRLVARQAGVLAGTAAAAEVLVQLGGDAKITWTRRDGDAVEAGDEIGRLEGSLRVVLGAERTVLNLLCHLSGIATLTRRYVEATAGRARIRDTRKTLPGLRALQKAAVRAGGGHNHRESLSDAVLIKDNHLAHAPIDEAVARARAQWPGRTVEVECDTLDQVRAVAVTGPDLVLLDNMDPADVARAAAILHPAGIPIEVSGRVDISRVAAYAEAGADFISVGALTHSAPSLDIGLDLD